MPATVAFRLFIAAGTAVSLLVVSAKLPIEAQEDGHHAAELDEWIAQLDSEIPEEREQACDVLAEARESAASATGRLGELLESDPSPEVRLSAARALMRIGPRARAAVPALTTALADPDERVRFMACEAIGAMGAAGAPAVPQLREWVRGDDPTARRRAIETLGRVGPAAATAVPDLVDLLTEAPPEDMARVVALAEALGRIGEDDASVIAALQSRWTIDLERRAQLPDEPAPDRCQDPDAEDSVTRLRRDLDQALVVIVSAIGLIGGERAQAARPALLTPLTRSGVARDPAARAAAQALFTLGTADLEEAVFAGLAEDLIAASPFRGWASSIVSATLEIQEGQEADELSGNLELIGRRSWYPRMTIRTADISNNRLSLSGDWMWGRKAWQSGPELETLPRVVVLDVLRVDENRLVLIGPWMEEGAFILTPSPR